MDKIINLRRSCPICNCEKGYYLDKIDMATEDNNCLPKLYNIVCCRECGFSFADMEASQDDYDRYYKNLNMYSDTEGLWINHEEHYRCVYSLIERHVSKSAHIIDIGCGGGNFLCFLKEKGYENLYGLDPSSQNIIGLKNRGINGKVGSIFENVSADYEKAFDLVVSTMVIEHVYDLNLYIQQLKRYLKSGGYLFIDAPAVEGFEEFVCPKPNYFNQEHINYFSENSLNNLLGKHGIRRFNEMAISLVGKEKCLCYLGQIGRDEYQVENDKISKKSIENYLKEWKEKQYEQLLKVEKIVTSNKRIVIFGYGQYTKQLLVQYPELIEKTKYFVDNNTTKHGLHMHDKEICPPERLIDDKEEIIVCICSMMNGQEILQQLTEMKLDKEIIKF